MQGNDRRILLSRCSQRSSQLQLRGGIGRRELAGQSEFVECFGQVLFPDQCDAKMFMSAGEIGIDRQGPLELRLGRGPILALRQ